MQKAIYITGGTGFIGSHILPLLLKSYDYVLNFKRDKKVQIHSKSSLKNIDLSKFKSSDYPSDFFINLATYYNSKPKNILELCGMVIFECTFFIFFTKNDVEHDFHVFC